MDPISTKILQSQDSATADRSCRGKAADDTNGILLREACSLDGSDTGLLKSSRQNVGLIQLRVAGESSRFSMFRDDYPNQIVGHPVLRRCREQVDFLAAINCSLVD
jgi:hypothetical protein